MQISLTPLSHRIEGSQRVLQLWRRNIQSSTAASLAAMAVIHAALGTAQTTFGADPQSDKAQAPVTEKAVSFAASDGKFFGLEVPDRPTVFVLDYSSSMGEQNRRGFVEAELGKALSHLKEGTPYQVVLFAGYVWLPGDKISLAADKASVTVTDPGGETFSWAHPPNSLEWRAVNRGNKHYLRTVAWQKVGPAEIAKTMADVKNTPLEKSGGSWQFPLEMALGANPSPQAIYFVTDGISSSEDPKRTEDAIIKVAYHSRTRINAVAMMEPKEIASLMNLSKTTGGGLSIAKTDGTAQVVFQGKKP